MYTALFFAMTMRMMSSQVRPDHWSCTDWHSTHAEFLQRFPESFQPEIPGPTTISTASSSMTMYFGVLISVDRGGVQSLNVSLCDLSLVKEMCAFDSCQFFASTCIVCWRSLTMQHSIWSKYWASTAVSLPSMVSGDFHHCQPPSVHSYSSPS